MRLFLNFIFVLFTINLFAGVPLTPNPNVAPGHYCTTEDPDFKEFRYKERISYCRRKVSSSLKRALYDYYSIPKHCRRYYTIDHIIPLSLGGDNTPQNLWPEHKSVKATRQNLEYELYLNLRDSRMTQQQAVHIILRDKFNPRLPRGFKPSPNCPN